MDVGVFIFSVLMFLAGVTLLAFNKAIGAYMHQNEPDFFRKIAIMNPRQHVVAVGFIVAVIGLLLAIDQNRRTIVQGLCLLIAGSGPCHINERIDRERAVNHTKAIRDAQRVYFARFNAYGTLTELVDQDLIPDELADSDDDNFHFELTANGSRYILRVTPTANVHQEEISLYLDESGIVRGSVNPDKRASSTSDPLRVAQE